MEEITRWVLLLAVIGIAGWSLFWWLWENESHDNITPRALFGFGLAFLVAIGLLTGEPRVRIHASAREMSANGVDISSSA